MDRLFLILLSFFLNVSDAQENTDSKSIITASLLEKKLAIPFYELELAKYHLKLSALDNLVREGLVENVAIPEPQRPEIELPELSHLQVGQTDAPLSIDLICNFTSRPCLDAYKKIRKLTSQLATSVNWRFFSFPTRYHRDSLLSSVAAYCGAQQDKPLPFLDALVGLNGELSRARLEATALAAGLDSKKFLQCLDLSHNQKTIKKDATALAELGFKRIPALLLDGYYYPHPIDWEKVQRSLHEAGHLFVGSELPKSKLPFLLRSTVVAAEPEKSLASIITKSEAKESLYAPGNELIPGVKLHSIFAERVILLEENQFTQLPLKGSRKAGQVDSFASSSDEQQRSDLSISPGSDRQHYEEMPATMTLQILDTWLKPEKLSQLRELFQPAEHRVEGFALLRIEDVADAAWLKQLGLQAGDVVLRIADEWIHEGNNPLPSYLENKQDTRVALMRGGLPVIIDWTFANADKQ